MAHEFTGQRRRRKKRGSGFSQAMTRREITLYDQHGREWSASVEQKSGMPTGMISPSFEAPWRPDAQYLKVNPDNTSELYIDYETMYKRRRARLEQYHRDAVTKAAANKWPTPEKGKYSQEVLETLGRPPKPLEPVAAAMQGHPWILGFSKTPDPRLVPFLHVNRREVTPEEIDGYDFGPDSYKRTVENLRKVEVTEPDDDEGGDDELAAAEITPPATPRAQRAAQRLAQHEAPKPPAIAPAAQVPAAEVETELELLADGSDDDATSLLDGLTDEEELEEAHDAQGLGGRRVRPQTTERVERQAPRRQTQSPVARKRGAHRGGGNPRAVAKQAKAAAKTPKSSKGARAGWRAGRPSLADGAKPVVG